MYSNSYSETSVDCETQARGAEAEALGRSMELLEIAQSKGGRSTEAAEALHITRQLWCMLVEDLGNKENHLPPELRASLISIGIWVIKECEAIRQGDSENFKGIMDITQMIKEGLS